MSSAETISSAGSLSPAAVRSIASSLPFWGDKDPTEGQTYREELVRSLARLTAETNEFLDTCDSIIIDQNSAHLLGSYFEEVAGLLRNTGSFVTHTNIVPSRKRPNRITGLQEDIEEAYAHGMLGNRILIVTEHADTGETCETLSRIIREVVAKKGGSVDIVIAAVSVHPTKFFRPDASRKEKWVWGQRGIIGASAFRRNNMPVTHADMAELAQKVTTVVR